MNKCIAVIVGTGSYNDLGMIRSCGEDKMPVIYITDQKHIIPIHKSKYVIQTYFIQMTESALIKIIHQIVKTHNSVVIIYPTSDIAAYYLDCNYESLKDLCYFSNAKGKLRVLMNKYEMNKLAETCGLIIPQMRKVNLLELENYNDITYPCIVKPLRSIGGDKSDITKCYDINDLNKVFSIYRSKNHNEILIQQLINGKNQHEIAITGVADSDGNCIIKGDIIKKRIRGNGSTVFGIYRPNQHRELYLAIQEFIRKSGYQGIFDIEFLENDDNIYFIECNYRNGAYGYAVTYSGFNMPHIYKQFCLKQSLDSYEPKKITFMEERSDFLNVLDKNISLWSWIKDLFSTNVFLFWNKKDIRPLIRVPYFIKKILK